MSEKTLDSAEGIQDATAIARNFVETNQNGEWQRVVKTRDRGDSWEIYFKTSEYKLDQMIEVEKESGNIIGSDLAG